MSKCPAASFRTVSFGVICALAAASGSSQSKPNVPSKRNGATPAAQKLHSTATASSASKEELDALRLKIEDQHLQDQHRFDDLQRENQQLSRQFQAAEQKLAETGQQLGRITASQTPQFAVLLSQVAALRSAEAATADHVQKEERIEQQSLNPTALRYRSLTLVPGGFFAAEALYRSHAENADINTTWSAVPYRAQAMASLSEFRASARQTRLFLRADGPIGSATVTGYFETDFLASGFGASEAQINGYSNRVRQMWGRVQFPSGWTLASGQMWSLLTTNRIGIDNLTEMAPALVDATILPGFDYARQTSVRITKRFDDHKMTVALSAENAATIGATPANVPSNISNNLAGLSTTGTGILSNTTYSTNLAPDLVAKVAFDPGVGHYELKAVGRIFRDRLLATATVPGKNNTLRAGAIGAAAYIPLWKNRINYLMQGSWGAIGRYAATSTDVVVKPDGALSAEKSIHAISGFDTHPTARLDWYVYASGEYLPRNYGYGLRSIDNTKCFIEMGFSCAASLRNLHAAASGFWYRFYKGPAGTIQYGADYVYLAKQTWMGVGGAPRGIENVVETSFRYYLP